MLRIKIPQGIVTGVADARAGRRRARATRAASVTSPRDRTSSSISCCCSDVEAAMRELADEGLTTREACGNSVRNVTGCPYAGTSDDRDLRCHAVRRGDDALLPAPSAQRRAAAQVQDRLRRLHARITRSRRSTTSAGARASSMAARVPRDASPAARRSCRCPVTCSTTSSRSRRCSKSRRRSCGCSTASATTSIRSGTG